MSLPRQVIEAGRAEWPADSGRGCEVKSHVRWGRSVACVICLALFAGAQVLAEGGTKQAVDTLPIGTIIQQLVQHNQQRAEEIGTYTSRRHYHIEYKGFPHGAEADLVVDVTCDGPSGRHFAIVSESGSGLLIRHVLLRLLKAEEQGASNHQSNDLTPANYKFSLMRSEVDDGRNVYLLRVRPKVSRKLLYRGTIWVDAHDFAVVKIEAHPAKRLSFWVRDITIHHVYGRHGQFWLPASDKSESRVLLGGQAILMINYGDYRFLHAGAEQASVNADQ